MNELAPAPPNPSDNDVHRRTSHNGVRLPWPTDWTALFGRSAPLVMEIGFGGGHFLVDLAKQNPASNVVGVEISHHCLREAERKMAGLGLRNLHLIHLDAVATLAYVCAPASIDRLYINFPDPFPKTAHAQRRLLAPYSLALIRARLKPGALLTIATDVPAYADSIAADLAACVGLRNRHKMPWLSELPGRTVTRYERKALDQGHPCHYFEWERDPASSLLPDVAIPPQPGELMPNVVLRSTLPLQTIAEAFEQMEYREGDIHVRLLAIYNNMKQQGLLIDSFIDEPLIEQRPGIAIAAPDEPDRYVIRLSLIGYPRPTAGAHVAVRFVADWLTTLDPQAEVIHRNVNER